MQVLDQIIALTETVEQHVERGEWNEAGALDAERCRLLSELFADPAAAPDLADHRDVLQQLLMRNTQTVERVRERRQQLASESAQWRQASGAVRAYRYNAGNQSAPTGGHDTGAAIGNTATRDKLTHLTAMNDHEPTDQR